jgi:hypothetical protein
LGRNITRCFFMPTTLRRNITNRITSFFAFTELHLLTSFST